MSFDPDVPPSERRYQPVANLWQDIVVAYTAQTGAHGESFSFLSTGGSVKFERPIFVDNDAGSSLGFTGECAAGVTFNAAGYQAEWSNALFLKGKPAFKLYDGGYSCTGCADFCATMTFDDLDVYSTDNSVALWIPSCYLVWADLYIAVQPAEQYALDHPVEYNLQVDQYRDFELLQPNHNVQASFKDDNWDYDFYYSIAAEPESMRWRVVVIDGEGVLVTVRNHRCPRQATWSKQVWCDADYFDRPWMCDIEIPTRAAHPGDNAFFVSVNGKNATYSIAFWRGRENCHAFTGTGRHEGLDFCAGLVPYGTWRWENYTHLDNEAHCFFETLYEHFRVQPCYTGVTPECNATLQAFACYESFKRCDEQGFYVGTCRDECQGVAYECANNFETVDLEHYNCDSARYLDAHSQTCTGGRAFNSLDTHNHLLGSEPDVLLFESSPSQQESQSSATRLSGLFVTFLVVLIASLI